jgi:hypothetical protein
LQLQHQATCHGGGCLTRHAHDTRVRPGDLTIWRVPCTTCQAVFTVLPPCVIRYRSRRPDVARNALLATHGGRRLERCAVLGSSAPMALSRLVGALGHPRLVSVLTRCGLPRPPSFLAAEKPRRGLTDTVYLPTVVSGRVRWPLGSTEEASAAALTLSSQAFPRAALPYDPAYRGRGIVPDGFDSPPRG